MNITHFNRRRAAVIKRNARNRPIAERDLKEGFRMLATEACCVARAHALGISTQFVFNEEECSRVEFVAYANALIARARKILT